MLWPQQAHGASQWTLDMPTLMAVHKHGTCKPHVEADSQLKISPGDTSFPRLMSSVSWPAHPLLVGILGDSWGGILELAPNMEGTERGEMQAPLNWWTVRVTRNLAHGVCLVCCRNSRSLHLPTSILKAHMKTFIGFSRMYCPDCLNNTSQS